METYENYTRLLIEIEEDGLAIVGKGDSGRPHIGHQTADVDAPVDQGIADGLHLLLLTLTLTFGRACFRSAELERVPLSSR